MKIGDKVTWAHTTRGRNTLGMVLRKGAIIGFTDEGAAVVEKKNKRTETVPIKQLRLETEKSVISEFVEAIREVHNENSI